MLTEVEKEVVRGMCECDMNMERVAKKLYCHRNTIYYHLARIHRKTGLDPKKFWELVALERLL